MTEPAHTPDAPSASQRLADELAGSAITERRTDQARRVAAPSTVSRRRAVHISLAVAVPILIAVLLVQFAWQPLMSLFDVAPPPAIARQQAQETMDAVVMGIESFRKDYKTLPVTLVDIGIPARGQWSYAVAGRAHYTVHGSLYGQAVSFDSATAAPTPAK